MFEVNLFNQEPVSNVGKPLLQEWKKEHTAQAGTARLSSSRISTTKPQDSPARSDASTAAEKGRPRRAKLRIVHDSSSQPHSETDIVGGGSRTPTLIASTASSIVPSPNSHLSLVEISETQEPVRSPQPRVVSVNIPLVSINKDDYESLRGSQISLHDPALGSSSPLDKTQTTSQTQSHQNSNTGTSRRLPHSQSSARGNQSVKSASGQSLHPVLEDLTSSIQDPKASSQAYVPRSLGSPLAFVSGGQSRGDQASIVHDSSPARTDFSGFSPLLIPEQTTPATQAISQHSSQAVRSNPSSRSNHTDSGGPGAYPPPDAQQQQSWAFVDSYQHSVESPEPLHQSQQATQDSEPWQFQSQAFCQLHNSNLLLSVTKPGCTFTRPKPELFPALTLSTVRDTGSAVGRPPLSQHTPQFVEDLDMTSPSVRQSPRTRNGTPSSTTKSITTPLRERVRRARGSQVPEDQPASAQKGVPPIDKELILGTSPPSSNITNNKGIPSKQRSSVVPMSTSKPVSSSDAMILDHIEPALTASVAPQASMYDAALGSSAMPIQQSIEEEPASSTEEQNSLDSKTSSSQQSVANERLVPQVDGYFMPTGPILGSAEYAVAFPAEGKVQSTYTDTIKCKRKALLKFLSRRDSVVSANASSRRVSRVYLSRSEFTDSNRLSKGMKWLN